MRRQRTIQKRKAKFLERLKRVLAGALTEMREVKRADKEARKPSREANVARGHQACITRAERDPVWAAKWNYKPWFVPRPPVSPTQISKNGWATRKARYGKSGKPPKETDE